MATAIHGTQPNNHDEVNQKGENNQSIYLDSKMSDHEAMMQRVQTAGGVSMSPELFEKLYLSPQNVVKGDLRKTFGNPTPLFVASFSQSYHTEY
jgi:uncharacterized protein